MRAETNLTKGFKKDGKFRPTGKKKGKSSKPKSTEVFGIKLFQKEPVSAGKVTTRIKADLNARQELREKNTLLVSEIEDNPQSEFNIPRRNKIKTNNGEIKRLNKDIKNNFNSLNKEQKEKLPVEIQSQLRTG